MFLQGCFFKLDPHSHEFLSVFLVIVGVAETFSSTFVNAQVDFSGRIQMLSGYRILKKFLSIPESFPGFTILKPTPE